MNGLEHELLVVRAGNRLLDPLVRPLLLAMGRHPEPGAQLVPDYLIMSVLVVIGWYRWQRDWRAQREAIG